MTSAPDASAWRDGVSPYSRICSRVVVGVELADDDQEKQAVELRDRALQRRTVVGGRLDAFERLLEPGEPGTLVGQLLSGAVGQEAVQHD
jgi:hypothetical protein